MSLTNTQAHYGTISKVFHWSIMLLIFTAIPLGVAAGRVPLENIEFKAQLYSFHKTIGVTVFLLALLRITWALIQTKPEPIYPERKAETFAAELVHWLLYGALILVPLSGWIEHAATSGFAPILWPFGQGLPLVSKSEHLAETFAGLHIVFKNVLIGAILLHVAGALKHVFIDKDGTLGRMWFGASDYVASGGHHSQALPALTAGGIWLAALGLGGGMNLLNAPHDTATAPTVVAAATSEWQVESGSIGIVVVNFGDELQGSFGEWTADISYDPDTKTGAVETTISVPSLTLGSVTSDALGADYFDGAGFPNAVWKGTLNAGMAEGALTLKGAEVPVSFPYELDITDGVATVSAALSLNRNDFGIGSATDTSLAETVEVQIELKARR